MTDKLSIASEMMAFDNKDRNFYNSLTEDERKKFSTYLMIRWGSCVSGSADLQTYYLQSTNLRLNKNFFAVNKTQHDKLNWLASTTVSPGMGNQRHNWLSLKKKDGGTTAKVEKFLATLYPAMKLSDISLMAKLNTNAAIKELAKEMGYSDKEIKAML